MENVLVDMDYGGRRRKLLIHPGRTGFVFVLDRETGELLSAEKLRADQLGERLRPQDRQAGRGSRQADALRHSTPRTSVRRRPAPRTSSRRRSRRGPGLLYIPAHNTCMDYEGIEANYIAGTPYLGAEREDVSGTGRLSGRARRLGRRAQPKGVEREGAEFPVYSGVLATGGDVVFYGTMDGWFKAVDARTGTESLEIPDRLRHRRQSDDLPRSGRQAVRRDLLGHRRLDGRSRVSFPLHRRSVRRARRRRRHEGHQSQNATGRSPLCFRLLSRFAVACCSVSQRALYLPRPAPFRVCADPNNLPYSNQQQQGFENKLAELIATDFGDEVTYTWYPQRGKFFRKNAPMPVYATW